MKLENPVNQNDLFDLEPTINVEVKATNQNIKAQNKPNPQANNSRGKDLKGICSLISNAIDQLGGGAVFSKEEFAGNINMSSNGGAFNDRFRVLTKLNLVAKNGDSYNFTDLAKKLKQSLETGDPTPAYNVLELKENFNFLIKNGYHEKTLQTDAISKLIQNVLELPKEESKRLAESFIEDIAYINSYRKNTTNVSNSTGSNIGQNGANEEIVKQEENRHNDMIVTTNEDEVVKKLQIDLTNGVFKVYISRPKVVTECDKDTMDFLIQKITKQILGEI